MTLLMPFLIVIIFVALAVLFWCLYKINMAKNNSKSAQQKRDTTNNNSMDFRWIIGLVVLVILTFIYEYRKTDNTYHTETLYTKYEGSSHGDTFKVKVEDKITGKTQHYNINNISNYATQMAKSSNISPSNKNYMKQNSALVQQASKAYGFIVSNDYKTVKFCSKYYPVNNLKRKYDLKFKDKKEKAIKILNNAFGSYGARNLESSFLSNPSVIRTFDKQIEDDYQSVRRLAAQDGIPNLTRKAYCKMIDDSADAAVEESYRTFIMMVPGF